MPLTAILESVGRLDATLDGLGCELAWESLYRTRPRAVLACTDCAGPMHAKISNRGGRFFAHDRRPIGCAAAGESEQHRVLKRQLAQAARAAGHRAELEVTAPHRGWRADVLATAPGGRRTALEAQISSASLDDVVERTRRYRDDGIDVVWFTPLSARWLGHVPSVQLQRPTRPGTPWKRTHPIVRRFSVEPCTCDPHPPWHSDLHAGWDHPTAMGLPAFVAAVLAGHLAPVQDGAPDNPRHDGWATPWDIEAATQYVELPDEEDATAYVPDPGAPWYQQWPPAEQRRLLEAATVWIWQTTGATLTARPLWAAAWLAGGLGLSRPGTGSWAITRAALIRPDPDRVDWRFLAGLPVVVGSPAEHDALKAKAPADARIIVLPEPSQ